MPERAHRGLPDLRADPPARRLGHQPHPGGRVACCCSPAGSGVRARGLVVVGVLGVLGFVLLARPEPSVLRAAVMGSVALLGMGTHGRRRGPRALGAAVLLLLLVDPWLAVSPGFALSALATAGILWFAPGWRDRLTRWLPRWVAEAIAVPLAAQLACTPLVAAISGQVSPGGGGGQPARRPGRRSGHRARAGGRRRRAGVGDARPVGRRSRPPGAPRGSSPSPCRVPACRWRRSRWSSGPVGIAVLDRALRGGQPVPRRRPGPAGQHAGPRAR